jgi:hypothetical protein
MYNTIFFEVASNRKDIEITDAVRTLDEPTYKKIEDNVKQIKLKGWESSLTITLLLMDALEDAVPGSRVIPMNVTINELSTRVINGSKFDFWIIQGD